MYNAHVIECTLNINDMQTLWIFLQHFLIFKKFVGGFMIIWTYILVILGAINEKKFSKTRCSRKH